MGFEWIADPQAWIALVTLTVLEIVLGIDNIVFISILVGQAAAGAARSARGASAWRWRCSRASRLLLSLTWIMRLTSPCSACSATHVSGRDLVLLGGGLFLLVRAPCEIHERSKGDGRGHGHRAPRRVVRAP